MNSEDATIALPPVVVIEDAYEQQLFLLGVVVSANAFEHARPVVQSMG